jgi:hypothetical protein
MVWSCSGIHDADMFRSFPADFRRGISGLAGMAMTDGFVWIMEFVSERTTL